MKYEFELVVTGAYLDEETNQINTTANTPHVGFDLDDYQRVSWPVPAENPLAPGTRVKVTVEVVE